MKNKARPSNTRLCALGGQAKKRIMLLYRKIFLIHAGLLILNSCASYKTEIITGRIEKITYQNTYIKTQKYEGVIFSKDYITWSFPNSDNRFTPTMSEVDYAEMILRKWIKETNNEKLNQVGNCPVIDRKLYKYKRQYFGFINSTGDKVIYINCFLENNGFWGFWDKNILKEPEDNKWKTEEKIVLDGCSNYWTIKVDLREKTLFDLKVNGIG